MPRFHPRNRRIRGSDFARDKFFQLHHIRSELSNSFARFLVGHRVVVQHPAERLFVQLQSIDFRGFRFLRRELPLDWLH